MNPTDEARNPADGKVEKAADSGREGRAREDLDLVRVLRRIDKIGHARFAVGAVILFFFLGTFAYLPAWPGDPSRIVSCACGDSVQQSWFLGWLPWALLHGHNPFFTNWFDFPSGVNLATNTEMPLLGLITAPLSLTAGPVASYGLLLWLAFPLSAVSAFFVLRRWTGSNLGAFSGAFLYGFSPYMVNQGLLHLNLVFVPLPPLILMALIEIVVVQRSSPFSWGVLAGVLISAQYLISPEVLATVLVMSAIALIVLAAARFRSINRARVDHVLHALAPGIGIPLVVLAYPVYFLLVGRSHLNGPAFPLDNRYRADFLGMVVPTLGELFAPHHLAEIGTSYVGHDRGENGSYLGIPLLVLTVASIIRYWRNPWIRLLSVLAASAFVLSLGPRLVVANHLTQIGLPFDILGRLPLLDNILPARISLYATFFVAVIISLAVASVTCGPRPRSARRQLPIHVAVAVLAVAALLSLVPAWPYPTVDPNSAVPSFFRTPASSEIPDGAVVLAFPFPTYPWNQAMLWQAVDKWRWKIVGGYALIPTPSGSSELPPALQPPAVQEFLDYWDVPRGIVDSVSRKRLPANSKLVSDLRDYVRRNDITAVIFEPAGRDAAFVLSHFERAFGRPRKIGGVEIWTAPDRR